MEYANLDICNTHRSTCLFNDFSILQPMKLKKHIKTLLLLVTSLVSKTLFAQGCAMCKAVAETSIAGGNSQGAGLNAGILYIMVFPYILIGVGFFFWYRHRKQMQSEQES